MGTLKERELTANKMCSWLLLSFSPFDIWLNCVMGKGFSRRAYELAERGIKKWYTLRWSHHNPDAASPKAQKFDLVGLQRTDQTQVQTQANTEGSTGRTHPSSPWRDSCMASHLTIRSVQKELKFKQEEIVIWSEELRSWKFPILKLHHSTPNMCYGK